MAGGEPPEKYVLRINLTDVTDAVELNLDVVGTRLAEKNFLTQRRLRNIVGSGVSGTPANKASNLMRSIESHIESSDKREEWFEKFVLILANDTDAGELVQKLSGDLVKAKPNYKGALLKYIPKSQDQMVRMQPDSQAQGQKGVITPDSPAEALTTSGASAGSSADTSSKDQAGPSGQMGRVLSDSSPPATENQPGESDGILCDNLECECNNFAKSFWEFEFVDDLDGNDIVIAILDSGIQASHEAFKHKILEKYSRNFCSPVPNDSNVDDGYGHGTRCAGIAAGLPFDYVMPPNTSDKFTYLGGVAPGAKLVICKVTNDKSPSQQAVEDALQHICDIQKECHVHVVSMSFGFRCRPPQTLQKKINALADQGTICVASAGNDASKYLRPVLCPASCQNTIAVGSHAQNGEPSTFSAKGEKVCCLALGEKVCAPTIDSKNQPNHKALTCCNGTSEAAPAVAGLIALIIQSMIKVKKGDEVNFDTIQRVLEGMAKKEKNKVLRPNEFFVGIRDNPQFLDTFIR